MNSLMALILSLNTPWANDIALFGLRASNDHSLGDLGT
jgi:hypothetical protein